jgi:hypothetical protein
MNIIKLKDVVMPDSYRFAEFFNEKLKGRYAYWVRMRYILAFDTVLGEDSHPLQVYSQLEQMDTIDLLQALNMYNVKYIDTMNDTDEGMGSIFYVNFVDLDATELANAIYDYETANEYVSDFDIDMTKLRRFRSWLANEILLFNKKVTGDDTVEYLDNITPNQAHMFEYYRDNMYNEVVKQLSIFGIDGAFSLNTSTNTTSSCCNNINAIQLNVGNQTMCNALDTYRKNLHNLMVQTFEDVNFWLKFNKDFIDVFKRYIDNIIKTGLLINIQEYTGVQVLCNCANNTISHEILTRLSQALQYIIDGNTKSHLNFIHDALYDWADQLYDKMSWEIK